MKGEGPTPRPHTGWGKQEDAKGRRGLHQAPTNKHGQRCVVAGEHQAAAPGSLERQC